MACSNDRGVSIFGRGHNANAVATADREGGSGQKLWAERVQGSSGGTAELM